jgi:hypothetical protein
MISLPGTAQPVFSNPVVTTVSSGGPAVNPFAGTWSSLPANTAPPAGTPFASLTADAQGRLTVWARSADGQIIAHHAQGTISTTGSFAANSSDGQVQLTGQISADGQTAQINAARAGFVTVTFTAPRRPVVNSLPASLVGTFKGAGTATNGDQLQIFFSTDPGGNATLAGDLTTVAGARDHQFATLIVDASGRLISSNGNVQVGQLQAANGGLALTYNFQLTGYQNSFTIPLQPGP